MQRIVLLAVLVLGLAAAGCSGDDGGSTAPGTTVAAVGSTIPAATLQAPLDQGYKVDPDGTQSIPAPEELPVTPGSVQAWWYHTNKAYVVVYAGLSLDDYGPLCPGTSIQIGAELDNVSNSPTAPGGCPGRLKKTLARKKAGVRACGPLLVYLTEVEWGSQGLLYASIETLVGSELLGVTSSVDTTTVEPPEIELSTEGYTVPAGTLPDGSTQVTC